MAKKVVRDYEAGKEVDLQELTEATKGEPLTEPKPKTKQVKKAAIYRVTKDFEYLKVEYEAGDEFIPPAGWERDEEYDEFRQVQTLKQRSAPGIAFAYPGEIIDKKTGERQVHRAILPLEEV